MRLGSMCDCLWGASCRCRGSQGQKDTAAASRGLAGQSNQQYRKAPRGGMSSQQIGPAPSRLAPQSRSRLIPATSARPKAEGTAVRLVNRRRRPADRPAHLQRVHPPYADFRGAQHSWPSNGVVGLTAAFVSLLGSSGTFFYLRFSHCNRLSSVATDDGMAASHGLQPTYPRFT
jgi:hypothetical protein